MTQKDIINSISGKQKLISILVAFSMFTLIFLISAEQENVEASNFGNNKIFADLNEITNQSNNEISGTIIETNRLFSDNLFKYENLENKNYNITLNFTYYSENLDNSNLELYFGFTSFGQVIQNKNYFSYKNKDGKHQLIHFGDELLYLNNAKNLEEENNYLIKYIVNKNQSTIKLEIKSKDINETLIADISEEFPNGINSQNSWISIPSLSKSSKIKINELSIIYE